MRKLVLRRLALILIALFVVSVGVFFLVQVVPGQPGRVVLGPYATQQQVALWQRQHGLDGSVLARYLRWISGFVRGQWGTSLTLDVPVRPLVIGRLGNSVLLGLLAFVFMAPTSVAVGIWQAHRLGTKSDRAMTLTSVTFSSTPEFVTGVIFLILFAVRIHVFPVDAQVAGGGIERLRGMILPAAAVALVSFGYVARMARAGTAAVLSSPYYRTAVLNGVPRRRLLTRHLLRNALVPTTAVLGSQVAYMLGGLVVVETLFNYPGLGQLLVSAATDKDIFVLEASALTAAAVSMLLILATDIAYGLLDPRITWSAIDR